MRRAWPFVLHATDGLGGGVGRIRGEGRSRGPCPSFNAARVGRPRTQTDSPSRMNRTSAGEGSVLASLPRWRNGRGGRPSATTATGLSSGDAGKRTSSRSARLGSSDSRANGTPRGPRGRGAGGSGTETEGLRTTRAEGVHGFHGFPGEGCPLGWGGRASCRGTPGRCRKG